jgi:5-methylcytosine-specific restriction endonuclease McrA
MGRKKIEINPGDTFPNKHWKVIKETEKRGKERYFLCECMLCRKNYEIGLNELRKTNNSFCCRSCAHSNDLTGQRFGRLIVISKHSQYNRGRWDYNCICDCGNEKVIRGNNLQSSNTTSCGCYHKERLISAHSGENSNFWKGGITGRNRIDRNYLSSIINPIIRERDEFTCQKCNMQGAELNCHHIFDFSNYTELRFEEANLVTLCENCHMYDFHYIYSNRQPNTLTDLEDWMGKEYKYRNELLEIYNEYYNT